MEFVRLVFQCLLILAGLVVCRWCFLSLAAPFWRLDDEPAALSAGFKVYWLCLMLGCGVGGGAMAMDRMVDLCHRAFRLPSTHPVLVLRTKARRVIGMFCKLIGASGMVAACITGLVLLPGKWRSVDGTTLGEVAAMTIGLPIWCGIAVAMGIQEVLPLFRRIWPGRDEDDHEPPPGPLNGDPVPAPLPPGGPKTLVARAIPPRG